MALTPQEELELQQLEAEQEALTSQFNSIKEQLTPKKKPETGMLEAGARGFAQGLTFETADELTARAESILTGKSYEEALKESRAEYKAAEEEYPITSGIGGIAGGIAQGVGLAAATGGAGAAASAAGTASKLGKVGQLAKAALLPSAGKSAAANIGSAALSGATYGGLTEIGQSEKEGLSRLEEVPTAITTGAVLGGTLGGAVEGTKKVAKKVSNAVSKLIDEEKVPYSIRKIRDLYRAGVEGQGFITEKSGKEINKQVEKAAEDSVDLVQKNLDDVRTLKKSILNTVDQPIEVVSSYNSLQQKLGNLAKQNLSDSPKALQRVVGIFENSGIDESGKLPAVATDDVIRKLEDYLLDNADSSTEVKSAIKDAANELKLNLRLSVKSEDVYKALKDNQSMLSEYEKYVSKLTDEALENSDVLTQYEKNFLAGLKRSVTAKQKRGEGLTEEEFKKTIGDLRRGRPKKAPKEKPVKPSEVKDIEYALKEAKGMLKEKSLSNPLGRLDTIMHNILNASESLGGITRVDGPELKRKFKMFDILRQTTAETGTGQKAAMKYEDAIKDLEKANPKLAEEFKKISEPAINLIENKKFLEGAKLGEGPKDVSALRQFVTAPAVGTGLAANLLGQVSKSKTAQTMLRPTVAFLQNKKRVIDDALVVDPDNKILQRVSNGLSDAIASKDETRRAAMLNTLMQYESIRKLFKDEE
jgi:hypothetical protein